MIASVSSSVWSVPGMRVLAVMTVAGFSGYAVLMPVAPLWAVHGGADAAGAGLVNGLLMAATVATQLAVPALLRRFGWAPVLGSGLALMGLGGLAHLVSDALPVILALAVVRGAGFGILTVTGSAAAGLLIDPARRGAAIGAYGLAVALPNLALLPVGPVVVEHWGYAPMFLAAALPLAGVPFAAALARHLTEDDEEEAATGRPTAPVLAAAFVLFSVTLAGGALLTFAPQLVVDQAIATAALLVLGLTGALARWRVGAIADRHGPHRFLPPLLLVTFASMALLSWVVRDPTLAGVRTPAFLLGCALLGLAYGALQNLTLVAAFAAVPRRDTHTASAVWNIGFDAGTAVGSVLVGLVAAGLGFSPALLLAGAAALLALPAATLTLARR